MCLILVAGYDEIKAKEFEDILSYIKFRIILDRIVTIGKLNNTPTFLWFLLRYGFARWLLKMKFWLVGIWSVLLMNFCILVELSVVSFDVVTSVDMSLVLRKRDGPDKE